MKLAPITEEFEMMTARPSLNRLAAIAIRAAAYGVAPIVMAAGALAPIQTASAQQIKSVDAYYATVTKDNVPMKCADGGIFYAVAILKQGQVLRVDGEGPGWMRVEYLPGMKAYVKAAEVTPEAGGKTIALSRPSRLMAANVQGTRPWQFLLDSDLPAGTTFTVLETVKGTDGAVEGYLVPAPAQARGYVKSDQLRRATPEETAAHAATKAPADTGRTEAAKAAATPETAPTTTPSNTDQTTAPTATPPTPGATTPDGTPTQQTATNTTPAQPATPETPKLKAIKDLETLRTMFNNAMQKVENEEEIKTVMAEFDRTTTSLGDADEDQRLRQALASRKEALKLRLEVFETSKKIREASKAWNEKELQLQQYVNDVEKQAIYTIVGRIVPSTVYDGRRGMPLMYRVESADSSSTRTIGYVIPREGVDLLTVSGKVVGIVGESRMDEALRLNIVAARRVTVLNPTTTPRPAAPTPSEDAPTGPETATGENEKPGE